MHGQQLVGKRLPRSGLVQRYINRKQQTLGAAAIKQHRVVLSNALKRAERVGRVAKNIARLVDAPSQTRKKRPTLSIDQVRTQLLPAVEGDRLYAAYLVLFLSGLRRGELLGLRWQDVDFEARTLQVSQELERVPNPAGTKPKTILAFLPPKTEQSRRTVALPEECITALRQHKARMATEQLALGPGFQDQDLVFCHEDGRPIDPRTMNYRFTQALRAAGLPHIRVHDGRHTYASLMLQLGVPLKVVSDQLGHSSVAITGDVYSHVTAEVAHKAAATLNAAFTTRQ